MNDLLEFARRIGSRGKRLLSERGFTFDRPLVVLQSDDWGRVGVRDRAGLEELREAGIQLGENPYDFYTLETAADVGAIHEMLLGHRDSAGRAPCLVMNFLTANVDFDATLASRGRQVQFRALARGLPGKWSRPGLFDAYRDGIADAAFYPALHGLSHFCRSSVERAAGHEFRSELLGKFWGANTGYIYWRMPWIGYEYWRSEPTPQSGFLDPAEQHSLVCQAVEQFRNLFGMAPGSACAPGYRANASTHQAWSACGVRVVQKGSGSWQAPWIDPFGLMHLHRTVDFEPAVHPEFSVEQALTETEESFARKLPAVISVHSINFHSTLRDFRGSTIRALDQFLTRLEQRHPDLLYVHDVDIFEIVQQGRFESLDGWVKVKAEQNNWAGRAAIGGV